MQHWHNTEAKNMLDEQTRILAEDVFLPIGKAAEQLPNIQMVGFSAMRGSKYDGHLMVVGRAVNSFWQAQFPSEFSTQEAAIFFAKKVINDSNNPINCPMGWLNESWAGKVKYKARRSTYWRAIHAVMENFRLITPDDESWASKLVWSNLYKLSPQSGGNPSNHVCELQLSGCIELLQSEIEHHRPAKVLFLTGMDWAEPFLRGLGFQYESDLTTSQVEGFGRTVLNDGHQFSYVIASHPQGKPGGHRKWADDVLSKFERL